MHVICEPASCLRMRAKDALQLAQSSHFSFQFCMPLNICETAVAIFEVDTCSPARAFCLFAAQLHRSGCPHASALGRPALGRRLQGRGIARGNLNSARAMPCQQCHALASILTHASSWAESSMERMGSIVCMRTQHGHVNLTDCQCWWCIRAPAGCPMRRNNPVCSSCSCTSYTGVLADVATACMSSAPVHHAQACAFGEELMLAACGDFCGPPNAEGALLSGLAAARAVAAAVHAQA